MSRIVIVDDETKLTSLLKDFLALKGYEVWATLKGEEALPLIETHQPTT